MLELKNHDKALPLKVIIGAGDQHYPRWISTGKEELNLLDDADWRVSFKHRQADIFLCEHVWEHLTFSEGVQAAKNCFNALTAGGKLRVAVPDGLFPNSEYQQMVQIGGPGPEDHPAADHKILFNYKTVTEMFEQAGFSVDLLEYCDEEGRFHYNQWDYSEAPIYRSLLSDHRNTKTQLGFVSLIIDANKP